MATPSGRGKKGAHAGLGKAEGRHPGAPKGAHAGLGKAAGRHPGAPKGAHAQKSEKGICIICGMARTGTPAAMELPIRAARKLRSLFRQPVKHTIACNEHLEEAKAARAKYEKKKRDYLLGAAAFFAFVLVGGLFFGKFDISMFVPALLGALIVALLPVFYYFPSFGK
jgi:hypothetical protein